MKKMGEYQGAIISSFDKKKNRLMYNRKNNNDKEFTAPGCDKNKDQIE
jgi:hypothetical protein